MQFIDQSPAYRAKSVTLDQAVATGRASLKLTPGCEKLGICFRPELEIANAFDRRIHERVKFNDLATGDKLDLMIDELLPDFYHPENLPLTGREVWTVRFVVDGSVERILRMDAEGLRRIERAEPAPAIELETDIVTLMAILRAAIAEFHQNRKDRAVPAVAPDPGEDEAAGGSGG